MMATWLTQRESITHNSNFLVVPCSSSYPSFTVIQVLVTSTARISIVPSSTASAILSLRKSLQSTTMRRKISISLFEVHRWYSDRLSINSPLFQSLQSHWYHMVSKSALRIEQTLPAMESQMDDLLNLTLPEVSRLTVCITETLCMREWLRNDYHYEGSRIMWPEKLSVL